MLPVKLICVYKHSARTNSLVLTVNQAAAEPRLPSIFEKELLYTNKTVWSHRHSIKVFFSSFFLQIKTPSFLNASCWWANLFTAVQMCFIHTDSLRSGMNWSWKCVFQKVSFLVSVWRTSLIHRGTNPCETFLVVLCKRSSERTQSVDAPLPHSFQTFIIPLIQIQFIFMICCNHCCYPLIVPLIAFSLLRLFKEQDLVYWILHEIMFAWLSGATAMRSAAGAAMCWKSRICNWICNEMKKTNGRVDIYFT